MSEPIIRVANGRVDGWIGEYIGRPMPRHVEAVVRRGSVLGNPYKPAAHTAPHHLKACHAYKAWLWGQINGGLATTGVRMELQRLKVLSLRPEGVTLICWCSPLPCHGDVIKGAIEWAHRQMIDFAETLE